MSQTSLDKLVENLTSIAQLLSESENLGVLSTLEHKKDRKKLKQVKSLIGEVYSKSKGIKSKFQVAYEKLKNSESDILDTSDNVTNIVENSSRPDSLITKEHAESEKSKDVESTDSESLTNGIANETNNAEEKNHSCSNESDDDSIAANSTEFEINDDVISNSDSEITSGNEKLIVKLKKKIKSTKTNNVTQCDSKSVEESNSNETVQTAKEAQLPEESSSEATQQPQVSNSIDKDSEKGDTECANESSDVNVQDKDTTTESRSEENQEDNKKLRPMIKLVDINKLMAPGATPIDTPSPKPKKTVKFDSSVIILSSSDEDSPKKSSKQYTHLNESSDNKRKYKGSKKHKEKQSRKDRESRAEKLDVGNADVSDSEEEILPRRTRGASKKQKQNSYVDKFQNLRAERCKRRKHLTHSSDSDDKEDNSKEDKKNSDEEKDKDSKINKKIDSQKLKRKKKGGILEKNVTLEGPSDSSSDDERLIILTGGATNSTPSKGTEQVDNIPEIDKDDIKFKLQVFISLPKITCEDLCDIYRKKKELLEIKELTDMNFKRKSRSEKPTPFFENSDGDSEKQKSKESSKKKVVTKNNHESESDNEHLDSNVDKNMNLETEAAEQVVSMEEDNNIGEERGEELLAETLMERDETTEHDKNEKESEEDKQNQAEKEESNDNEKDETTSKDSEEKDTATNKEVENLEDNTETEANEKKRKKQQCDSNSSSDRENEGGSEAKKLKSDELLRDKLDSSDSDKETETKNKDKQQSSDDDDEVQTTTKFHKRRKGKKATVISDSESEEGNSNEKEDKDNSPSSSESEKEKEDEDSDSEKEQKKKSRSRIKRTKDSSSEDEDRSTRKTIRRLIDRDSLSETTKKAEADEKERKTRIAEKQKKYNQIFELKSDSVLDKIVLDFDEKNDKELLSVPKKLTKNLKPHQVNGVKFMWDACFESLEQVKKTAGSGCILAHCMGLGKTLQVIALIYTLLSNSKKTKVEKVMVVCPVNTVLNWKAEFKKWLPKDADFEVFDLVSCKTSSMNYERHSIAKDWHENGGVLIIGYNMFRNLSNPSFKTLPKKLRGLFQEALVDPGPDLIVCDEGHLLKNEKSNLSIAMNRVKTARRIVLTGTPLQNNLKEYWCMVQFIKPNLLGTYKEYLNRFVNPIINGQYTDSTPHDITLMRKRSHVLHKLLDGVVQRQDYAVLAPYLPPKYEYVLFIKLSEVQVKLYKYYMENLARRSKDNSNKTAFLFTDFQELQRICTHPRVLLDKSKEEKTKFVDDESDSAGSLKDFIDDASSAESSSSSESEKSDASSNSNNSHSKKKSKKAPAKSRLTRAQAAQKRENGESESEVEEIEGPKEWWQEYVDGDQLDNINNSGKILLLFQILKECEEIGDKVLLFSQSLYTLNCIEYFLRNLDEASETTDKEEIIGPSGSWALGLDYFRLDGSSSCDNRAAWCDSFNNPDNTRARLFLISTKAGGLGINLVSANRVIIFDVSWNPSHDVQSIYRVYRFGQTKPSYIYRFVSYGTMEMKIYERQVTKQAISKRVIDEQQIDRHYSQNDIMELYKTDLEPTDRPTPLVPKDVLLGEMIQKYDNTIFKYHEHQSLLENKEDEGLNEEERKAAWEEFENEKVLRKTTSVNFAALGNLQAFQNALNFSPQMIQVALGRIVRKDNPTWSEVQIRGILPALVQQLQVQMQENDFTMYNRVQQEIRLMQAIQAQQFREQYLQMIQKQQMQNQMLGSMHINPVLFARQMAMGGAQNMSAPNTSRAAPGVDIIELND